MSLLPLSLDNETLRFSVNRFCKIPKPERASRCCGGDFGAPQSPMASSSLSSLSSILSNPHGCSLCFKGSTRRCFALTFLSSKVVTHASSSALLPRCRSTHLLTQKPINRKNGFALNLSRSFSVSQIAGSGKFDGPSLHQFVSNAQAHASLTTPETESE